MRDYVTYPQSQSQGWNPGPTHNEAVITSRIPGIFPSVPLSKLLDWLQPKQGWEKGDLGHSTDSAITELCGHGQATSRLDLFPNL